MVGKIVRSGIVLMVFLFAACSSKIDSQPVDLLSAYDFENGSQDWVSGISDYPVGYQDSTMYLSSVDKVPASSPLNGNGLTVGAANPLGEIFYYFQHKESNMVPGQKYIVDFEFLVYTQLVTESADFANEDIYLKIGAVNFEPVLQEIVNRNLITPDYMMLNVDKGDSNPDSGKDLINMGSVKSFTGVSPEVISGNTFGRNIEVQANQNGEIWLLVGVDSGIKSQLNFGMAAINVYYKEKK